MKVKVNFTGEIEIEVPSEKIKELVNKWWDENDEDCFDKELLPLIPNGYHIRGIVKAGTNDTIYDGGW